MSLKSPRTWVAGGVLLALVLSVLGWMLLVAPQRAAADAARGQVTAARTVEETQRVRLAQLTADFAQLDAHRAELAAVRTSIPVELDLPALTRRLTAAAGSSSVTLMSVDRSTGATAAAAAAPASEPAATTGSSATATSTSGAATATSTSGAAAGAPVAALQTVPLSITVLGSFDGAEQFLRQLQTDDAPSLLVTGLAVTAQDPADASGAKPRTVNGDVQLVVSASAFVLPTTAS